MTVTRLRQAETSGAPTAWMPFHHTIPPSPPHALILCPLESAKAYQGVRLVRLSRCVLVEETKHLVAQKAGVRREHTDPGSPKSNRSGKFGAVEQTADATMTMMVERPRRLVVSLRKLSSSRRSV